MINKKNKKKQVKESAGELPIVESEQREREGTTDGGAEAKKGGKIGAESKVFDHFFC